MPALHFVLSDLVADEAAMAFVEQRDRIRERLPDVEVCHVGGTSLPGLLTSGDVDLQVRADRESFSSARDALGELYEPLQPGGWGPDSAYFAAGETIPCVEVSLTVIGTLDDLHHGAAWRRIGADPRLIETYNALKRAHEGGSADDYNAAKRAFFYENFTFRDIANLPD